MLKNNNKAFSIFFFILGLIAFLPAASRANQIAAQNEIPVIATSTTQDNRSLPMLRMGVLTDEPVHLNEELIALPIFSSIPTPTKSFLKKPAHLEEPKYDPEGGEK